MDEEVKSSLDLLEQRVSTTEKLFDAVKWYIGGATAIGAALTLVLGWNFSSERSAMREGFRDTLNDLQRWQDKFEKDANAKQEEARARFRDLEERLVGQAAVPQLVLLGPDAQPLADQQVEANVERGNDGTAQLSFRWALKNIGNGPSGPIWMKLYTQKDMPTSARSLDDPLFPYESRLEPGDLRPGNLPGKFSLAYSWSFHLPAPTPGLHRVLLKAFYGNGLVSEAPFSLEVK